MHCNPLYPLLVVAENSKIRKSGYNEQFGIRSYKNNVARETANNYHMYVNFKSLHFRENKNKAVRNLPNIHLLN